MFILGNEVSVLVKDGVVRKVVFVVSCHHFALMKNESAVVRNCPAIWLLCLCWSTDNYGDFTQSDGNQSSCQLMNCFRGGTYKGLSSNKVLNRVTRYRHFAELNQVGTLGGGLFCQFNQFGKIARNVSDNRVTLSHG